MATPPARPPMARVLHLEDDAKDHKLLRAALVEEGVDHAIERVDTAEAFRARLVDGGYEVVLADYNLPGFDGFAALGIARELCPDVPFIVVSGAMGDMAVAGILRAGATDFVLKEHLDRLGPAIRRALGEAAERRGRRAAEAAVREARDAAESANRAKDRFLAMLSHELRTPLSPVVMALTAIHDDPDLPAKFCDDLAMVRRNIDLEVTLIDDLLDLSRVMSGKLRLREAAAHVHAIVRHAIDNTAADAAAKGLSVAFEPGAADDRVLGDAARLQQVLWNLLRNAIKFTPDGGRVTVRTAAGDAGALRVEVADTGRGLPAGAIGRLFEPFEQVSPEVTREFGGLGLGLAIVKAVAELHGGRAWAASDGPGRGASFFVELPLAAAAVDAPAAPQTPATTGGAAASPARAAVRVLLVEDHDDTRKMLARLLKVSGFDVAAADSVAAATGLAATRPFDVVVSDIGLPDGTGYDLMAVLRDRHGLRGIALSGYGMEDDIARGRTAGFVEHIVKPVDFDHLRRVIAGVVGVGAAAV